jgi:hypothetical protein
VYRPPRRHAADPIDGTFSIRANVGHGDELTVSL